MQAAIFAGGSVGPCDPASVQALARKDLHGELPGEGAGAPGWCLGEDRLASFRFRSAVVSCFPQPSPQPSA